MLLRKDADTGRFTAGATGLGFTVLPNETMTQLVSIKDPGQYRIRIVHLLLLRPISLAVCQRMIDQDAWLFGFVIGCRGS